MYIHTYLYFNKETVKLQKKLNKLTRLNFYGYLYKYIIALKTEQKQKVIVWKLDAFNNWGCLLNLIK
jgi:hypothetical protein